MDEEIRNAKITGLSWNSERGLTHWIYLEGVGWGIGFGGYSLKGEACYDWITQIMKVLGVYEFDDKKLIGMIVRVKLADWSGPVKAIGHPLKELWFEPKEYFKKYTQHE